MKTEHNILIAFFLNIFFSLFEFFGGVVTGSVAIMSDAIHDMGDALSIGISYFLEKRSKKEPDDTYTYGYIRYSVLGAFITTTILTVGEALVIISSIRRIIEPTLINYNGMIIFAILGTVINFLAAFITKDGDSFNQKAVNLHMLEDVLGWVVVLIGAIVMKFTDISLIDSIMSIGVALFILINSLKNLKNIMDLFLEKIPSGISVDGLKEHLMGIRGVIGVHHIHIWGLDETNVYATMHVITDEKDIKRIKSNVREEMEEHGIKHVTIEIEDSKSACTDQECHIEIASNSLHTHHH